MTFWDTIAGGEYVMIALLVILILTIVIWWVWGARISRYNRSYKQLLPRLRDHVMEGDVENAHQLCESHSSPGACIIEEGLKSMGQPIKDIKDNMERVSSLKKNELDAGAPWLRFLGVVSPLLGLGGTLVGVIDKLRDLGETGNADTSMVCEAIAPCIVTTVAGLGAGIFALLALNCLESSINKAKRKIDQLILDFLNILNSPT